MARYNRPRLHRSGGQLLVVGLVWLLSWVVCVVGGRRLGVALLIGLAGLVVWLLVRG